MVPWTVKYQPKRIKEFAGNPTAVKRVLGWYQSWKPGNKALLLVGPPGIGKTTLALALARTFDVDVLEMNASDTRSKKAVERVAGLGSLYGSLTSKPRLILIDEVDGMSSNDRGGTSALVDVIKKSSFPIIMTANDSYAVSIRALKPYVEIVKMKRVNPLTVKAVLGKIAREEKVRVSDDVLTKIAHSCHGDLKSAINDFEALAEGETSIEEESLNVIGGRDRKEDMFNALRTLFKTEEFLKARQAIMGLDETPDIIKAWIDENIPREYERPREVANAYYWLARSDVFFGRIIRRQNWGLMSYALDFMTGGVALSKEKPYHKFTGYQFPSFIKLLSKTKKIRTVRHSLAKKIGERIHASPNEVIHEYLPYLSEMAKKSKDVRESFREHYELDDEETKVLLL